MSIWRHPQLDETLELNLQPRQRLIGSLTSPLTVDQAFMQYIPGPSPIQGTSTPLNPDLYTGGLDRLRKYAEASNVGGAEEEGQELEEETTTAIPRGVPLNPARPSNSSIPAIPPLPQTLPPRTVSRSRSGSKNIITPSAPQLKRAVTMRSTSSRSSIAEGARPKSSHSDADLTEREIYPRTSGFELGANLGRTQRVADVVPTLPSRIGTSSRPSIRKLSLSYSATPIGDAGQNSSEPQVWESAFQGMEDTEVGLARPRAPTPSTMLPTMPFTPDSNPPPSPYSSTPINPQFQLASHSQLTARSSTLTRSTSASRSRSRSVSAGPPATPPPLPPIASTSIPDDYIAEPYPLPPTTPPRSFARPPKSTSSAYIDPTGFPAPPSYPPVPSLVASGSTSTSTRSSAYTSPGASHPLSSSDLSALGIGLGQVVNHEVETHMLCEEDVLRLRGGLNEKAPPKAMSYASRDHSESSIARLQFATNAAALLAGNGNAGVITHGWTEPYASSIQSGSSFEGSPNPLSRIDPPKKMANAVWRSVNEDEDFEPDMDLDEAELPAAASTFTYQRSRNGTVASSNSASVSGLTSASEDETDADDYAFLKEVDELDEDVRTAAVVVAEEGRGLIVHGEGMDVSSVTIQPGTTHLLLSSSPSPHSIPSLLTQTLPNITTTLLALDISANFLSALPPALATCTQLTELNIANNPLRALPVWLSGLERLHVLIADSTGISTLPPELASLNALAILSIRRNKLMSLPPWLSYLPVLERIEVEGNPFQGPWKALLVPLMSARQPAPSISGSVQQQPSISSSSSHSDLNSVYGPGLSMYGESVSSIPPPTPSSANMQMRQSSFTGGEPLSPTEFNGSRKLLTEEEDYTIMPSRLVGQTLKSPVPLLPTPAQLTVPPLSPGPPTGMSTKSFASSINSPSRLPYMGDSPTSPIPEDRQEGSSLQRAPTFSVAERRTPSPYLRPLSRTRTTPNRSRTSAGSATGSIATFIAEQGHGGMRSRASSAASQRPLTDYVSTRYDKSSTMEDSGYYGSVTEYSAFRNSAGSEWLSFDVIKEDERKKELRRMRSADELRRALESVIGPSEPLALQEDENGGETTETDHGPVFHVPDVPRIDMRPSLKQSYTTADAETVSPSRAVALQDRPVAKRFASVGANAGLVGQATRVRLPLSESMWDGGVDADAEPDNDEVGKSRAASPTLQGEEVRRPKTSRKWGFLKKMSMGRMRPEPSAPKAAASPSQSPQTSPQGSNGIRIGISVSSIGNGVSPTPKPRLPSRESGLMNPSPNLSLVPSHLTSSSSSRSLAAPSSSLTVPAHVRTARRRSFLPLDGPPALHIPIPRTSPFMPEALIPAEAEEELQSAITDASRSLDSHLPPVPAPSQDSSAEYYNSDSRALRSVMAYLRDMADLGMANSAIPPLPPALPGNSSQQENIEARSRRPTVVENGRMLSEASLTSSSSSGPTTANTSLRSDEQRSNTMSVATSESGGSGKGDEERKYKNDKSKRALLIKEIIETERTYVQGLQELLDIYIRPASQPVNTLGNAVASTKETFIPAQERKIAFNGVDALFSFHHQVFLPALEQAARPLLLSRPDADASGELSTTVAEAVAMAFLSHAAFMRMYSTYINNFDNAVQRLKHWSHDQRKPGVLSPSSSTAHLAGMVLQQMAVAGASNSNEAVPTSGVQSLTSSQRKRIRQFLKRSRLNPKHSQINLEAYLLLPVQRIPRYRLLLEELVRCTPPKPDLLDDPLDRALNEIHSLANTMNEGKRESESRRRLVQWQSRIKGKFPSPLVQPHRRLIMDGVLNLTRVVRKSSVSFEVINPDGNKSNVQVECLAPEENPRSLVGVLCNDLLVLCKDPSSGQDKSGPVDLWAVLRMQTLSQPASIVHGGALRVVDNKAILYFTTSSTSDALTWCRAINMHIPVSKP